ncbi:hypothetical protein IFR05_001004 [Cadophora sp. M221]|nr:hypothetical protein IFR05_001004 [Cadophora sp. M221]
MQNYRLGAVVAGIFATLVIYPHPSLADWTFKSRPDLSPPVLNITIPAASEDGFLFMTHHRGIGVKITEPSGPVQSGSYIFTSKGELVWSGMGCLLDSSSNFHVTQYQGDDVLVAYQANAEWNAHRGVGHVTILNRNYVPIKTIVGNGILIDVHEFNVVDGKSVLMDAFMPIPYDLTPFGNPPESQWIFDATFQAIDLSEIDLETGEVLFEWSSLDHVSPAETIEPISTLSSGTGFSTAKAIDYMHINSLDKDGDDYLVSGRRTSTIFKIDGKSGKVIWRLGGRLSNFTLGPGVEFGLQHHARFISRSKGGHQTVISLFDNSGHHLDNFTGRYENNSSGKIIVIDTKNWTATLSQKFPAPDGLFASNTGSNQILPNGNVFINWGSPGAITEFTPNGTIVFHAYLDSGELFRNGHEFTYRATKSNWTGIPRENPALVALKHDEITTLYVSWNGDTETKFWRFFGAEESGKEILLGDEARSGFETSFRVGERPELTAFRAGAVGGDGKMTRMSKLVKSKPQIFPYVPGKDDSGDGDDGSQATMGSENGEL